MPERKIWLRKKAEPARLSPKKYQFKHCTIELTSFCNEYCIHCYLPAQRTYRHLDTMLTLKLLAELKKKGFLHICFTGGEPLLHPEFIKIYTQAKKIGFITDIITNGTLINKKHLALWKKYPPQEIAISYFSTNAKTHESITQSPGSWGKVMKSLLLLRNQKYKVILKVPVIEKNYTHIRKISAFANTLGIPMLLGYVHNSLDGRDLVSKLLPRGYKKPLNLPNHIPHYTEKVHRSAYANCGAGRRAVFISAEARLHPCVMVRTYAYDLAHHSLSSALNALRRKMNELIDTIQRPTQCTNCKYQGACAWCPGHSLIQYGVEDRIIPQICTFAKFEMDTHR